VLNVITRAGGALLMLSHPKLSIDIERFDVYHLRMTRTAEAMQLVPGPAECPTAGIGGTS
jgi:hypothetical protein